MAAATAPFTDVVTASSDAIDLTASDEEDAAHATSNGAATNVQDNVEQEENDDESDNEETELWESESFVEDLFFEGTRPDIIEGNDYCTKEETAMYKARLHEVGVDQFIRETISDNTVTAKKLCSAFVPGMHLLSFLDDTDDARFYGILGRGISNELNKRRKLADYNTMDDAASLLNKSNNILVITGAGISTNLGIPDFRSKHTGFYSRLRAEGIEDPEDVFHIDRFDEDPGLFYRLAGDIVPDIGKTSPTHAFIRLLQDKGKLRTNYTQNIDNVEGSAGISPDKLIQCHGSWATATCRKCDFKVPGHDIYDDVRKQQVAYCKRCEKLIQETKSETLKRKRLSCTGPKPKRRKSGEDSDDDDDDGRYDIPTPGVMKPDITFFGEKLPANFFERFKTQDREVADLVIVIGTSMQVAPVSEIPIALPRHVPQIYISRDPLSHSHIDFDIDFIGDCDVVCAELARRAGWKLEHDMLPSPSDPSISAFEDSASKWVVKPKPKLPGPVELPVLSDMASHVTSSPLTGATDD